MKHRNIITYLTRKLTFNILRPRYCSYIIRNINISSIKLILYKVNYYY